MIEIVDTTCQICGKDLFTPGEITHSIEGGDGLSCDRCFYQKAFEHWKQTADKRQELLRRCEWSAIIPYHIPACPICCNAQEDGHIPNCELARELGDV